VEEETIHPLSQPSKIYRQRDLLANWGFLLLPQEPATRLAVYSTSKKGFSADARLPQAEGRKNRLS
jgi:hypothetical protein